MLAVPTLVAGWNESLDEDRDELDLGSARKDEDLENIESSSEAEVRPGLHFAFNFIRLDLDEFVLALQLISYACSSVSAAAAIMWCRMLVGKCDM